MKIYISNAFLGFPPQSNSTGFSNASFTATKKPTDSRPSIFYDHKKVQHTSLNESLICHLQQVDAQ